MQDRDSGWSRSASVVLGALLIAVGAIFLVLQVYDVALPFDLGEVGWPLYIIVPGAILLLVGLALPDGPGVGLSVAGSIVTTVGLVLAYQEATDHYSSWAYAWALVGPTAVGAGMLMWGLLHGRAEVIRPGLSTLATGLALFLIGFAFFEGALSIGDDRGLAPLGRQALPLLLILLGIVIIIMRLWPRRQQTGAAFPSQWSPTSAAPSVDVGSAALNAPSDPTPAADAAKTPEDDRPA